MVNIFGLTTASELRKAQNESNNWQLFYSEANETIERFNQENKALKDSYRKSLAANVELAKTLEQISAENAAIAQKLEQITRKHDELAKDLAECRTWAKHLEAANQEQSELLAKQQGAITKALDEAKTIAELRNEQTVEFAQYKQAVRSAADNLLITINN